MGLTNPHQVLYMDDLVKGDDAIFAATGVTDGELLGVFVFRERATTHSVVMRAKTGTVRFIEGNHRLERKPTLVLLDPPLRIARRLQGCSNNETFGRE